MIGDFVDSVFGNAESKRLLLHKDSDDLCSIEYAMLCGNVSLLEYIVKKIQLTHLTRFVIL